MSVNYEYQKFFHWCQNYSVNWQKETWKRSDGLITRGVTLTPSNCVKEVIIFCHATGNDHLFPHVKLFKQLLMSGYAVISFDLDGHGAYSNVVLTKESLGSYLSSLLSEMQTLFAPFTAFSLIGDSLGACVILNYILENPKFMPKNVILASMPLKLDITWQKASYELCNLALPSFYQQISHYGWHGLLPAIGPFGRKAFPIRQNIHVDYVKAVKAIIDDLHLHERIKNLAIPCHVFKGSLDKIATDSTVYHCNSLITFSEVPRETHYTTIFSDKTLQRIKACLI